MALTYPDFFIAGHSKSGTTALYHFLRAHPAVFMSRPKEPNYFCHAFCRDPNPEGSFHAQTEAAYLALFAAAQPGQLRGEASAVYLYAEDAPAHIAAANPSAKLIVMLREPVSFLYSYFLQQRKNVITEGEDQTDFARALALEPERKAGHHLPKGCLVPELLYYRERVRYVDQLERLYRHFPPEQVLVLIYDDFQSDNEAVYRQVLGFLGVDPTFTPVFEVHNRGAELRSKRLQRIVRKITFGQGWAAPVQRMLKRVLPRSVRKSLADGMTKKVVFKPKEALDPVLERRLKQTYRAEVERLGDYLGRDLLRQWGYDAVEVTA